MGKNTRKNSFSEGISFFKSFTGLNALFLLASLILVVMSGIIRHWWLVNGGGYVGLWRTCTNISHCQTRHDLLKFQDHKEIDIVFTCLCIAACVLMTSLLFTPCRIVRSRCVASMQLFFCFIADGTIVLAICWSIIKVHIGKRCWAFMLMYIALGLVTWCLLFAFYCLIRRPTDDQRILIINEDEAELMMAKGGDGDDPDDL